MRWDFARVCRLEALRYSRLEICATRFVGSLDVFLTRIETLNSLRASASWTAAVLLPLWVLVPRITGSLRRDLRARAAERKAAEGQPQSKTWRKFGRFMGSKGA